MASKDVSDDKYRFLLKGDGEKDTKWRYGSPPNYDVVNKLFEEGKTKVINYFIFFIYTNVSIYVFIIDKIISTLKDLSFGNGTLNSQ